MLLVRADQLRPEDLVDLQGDEFADPGGNEQAYQFEYVQVIGSELETEECLRVDLESCGATGMPPSHRVRLGMVISRWKEGGVEHTLSREPTPHSDYPHEPGRLYDCPACMERCWCTTEHGSTECVFEGLHAWPERRDDGTPDWVELDVEARYADAGDVGGDNQVTAAFSRTWRRRTPGVLPVSWTQATFYVYEVWEKPPIYSEERHCYQIQKAYSEFTDPSDQGISEEFADYRYDDHPLSAGSRKQLVDALSVDDAEKLWQLVRG